MRVEPNSMPSAVLPFSTDFWISFLFMFISRKLKSLLQTQFAGKRHFHRARLDSCLDRHYLLPQRLRRRATEMGNGWHGPEGRQAVPKLSPVNWRRRGLRQRRNADMVETGSMPPDLKATFAKRSNFRRRLGASVSWRT